MRHRPLQSWWLALAAIAWLQAVPASAQRVAGPYAGLFGADPARDGNGQEFEFRGSLFGSRDNVTTRANDRALAVPDQQEPAPGPLGSTPWFLTSNSSAGAGAELAYFRRSDAVRIAAAGSSETSVYPEADNFVAPAHSGNGSLDFDLGSHVVIRATGSGSYSSFTYFAPFIAATAGSPSLLTPGVGFASGPQRNTRLAAGTGAAVTLTRRSTLTADADWSEWRFLDSPDDTVETRGARGALTYRLTRALGLRVGYGYQKGRYNVANLESATLRTIDAGIDYGDTLEFARRTALTFSTSTSAVQIANDTHYRVEGNATLSRGFARTWSSALIYARTTSFVAGFREPILADAVSADVNGLLSRRLMWLTDVGYSHGNVGFGSGNTFESLSATSRLEFALTGRLAVYGQYGYYHYRLPAGWTSVAVVPRLARQTVTAGLALWLPIINK